MYVARVRLERFRGFAEQVILPGRHAVVAPRPRAAAGPLPSLDPTGIDWIISSGESEPGHRAVDLDRIRDLRDGRAARASRSSSSFAGPGAADRLA
jgi:protein gp37